MKIENGIAYFDPDRDGKTLFFSDGVKRIGRLVFLDHRFEKIVVPSSVEEIGEQNFFYLDRSEKTPSYIRATHAKIFVASDFYAEKFFCERGRGDGITTYPAVGNCYEVTICALIKKEG